MVSIAEALSVLRPTVAPGDRPGRGDCYIQDESILEWTSGESQPTAEELAAVTQQQVDVARLTKSLLAAESSIRQPDLLDVTAAPVNLVFQVFGTRINNAFRAIGQPPPVLQLDVLNDVRALIGLPPLEPP